MIHTLCLFILHASVTSITRAHQTPSEWSPFNFKQGTNENTCNSIITDSSLSSHGRFNFLLYNMLKIQINQITTCVYHARQIL